MPFDASPTIYSPIPGDNGPNLKALIEDGKRWIQVDGVFCPIATSVKLTDGGLPADYLVIEPTAAAGRVTFDPSGIGRNAAVPSDPSYAAFDYSGNETPASYLAAPSAVGDTTITVASGAPYAVGSWVFISDASSNPNSTLLPLDGPMEVRQVKAKASNVLTLDRPLKRAHAANVIACLCQPILYPTFRNISFTGNAKGGVHVHLAQHGSFSGLRTLAWRGGSMLLVDNGGYQNTISDCYCTGTEPGNGPTQNLWGVAVEGNDETRVVGSGGELCGEGLTLNYCIDTIAVDCVAQRNNVNVAVRTSSIRTTIFRPQTLDPAALDTFIDDASTAQGCAIIGRVDLTDASAGADAEWRSFPSATRMGPTDSLLISTENKQLRQLFASALVTKDDAGRITDGIMELHSPTLADGNLRLTNANVQGQWLVGMLGATGSVAFVVYNIATGKIAIEFQPDGSTAYGNHLLPTDGGQFDVGAAAQPWRDVFANRNVKAGAAIYVAGIKVLDQQQPYVPDLPASASLADVIAAINADRAADRAHGLRAPA